MRKAERFTNNTRFLPKNLGRIYLELINAGDVKILVEKYPPRTYYAHFRQMDGETNIELFHRIMDHLYQIEMSNYENGLTPLCLPFKNAKEACGID